MASASAGDPIQLDDVVKNAGNLAAETFHVTYWLSDDDEITTDDIALGTGLSIPSLEAAAEAPSSTQLSMPAGVTPATWFVGAIVTLDSGTPESNTTNNSFVSAQTLDVTP